MSLDSADELHVHRAAADTLARLAASSELPARTPTLLARLARRLGPDLYEPGAIAMDSAQKRDRDRKNRQKRQDKEARRKEKAEQKLQRGGTPLPPDLNAPPDLNSPEVRIEREPRTGT